MFNREITLGKLYIKFQRRRQYNMYGWTFWTVGKKTLFLDITFGQFIFLAEWRG